MLGDLSDTLGAAPHERKPGGRAPSQSIRGTAGAYPVARHLYFYCDESMQMSTTKVSQEDVRETWEAYWEDKGLSAAQVPRLASYQQPVYDMLRQLVASHSYTSILNAGAGLDVISLHLQRDLANSLSLHLLDIAPKAIALNEKMFAEAGAKVETSVGSVFQMPFADQQFDIVFNTGLMEHFEASDQIAMVREVMRVLKPGGRYVSANPSDRGGLYKLGMACAKRKGTWEFGVEIPIRSLKFIAADLPDIGSIDEVERDFVGQVNFLNHVTSLTKYVMWPLNRANRISAVRKFLDATLGRAFGTYLLISTFTKRAR